VHTANLFELFWELVLTNFSFQFRSCLLVYFSQNFVQSLLTYPRLDDVHQESAFSVKNVV